MDRTQRANQFYQRGYLFLRFVNDRLLLLG